MKLLEGKTAVITGSSRGLGLAIAKAFAEQGTNVVLAARTQETLNTAVAELKSQGYKAEGFVCDTAKLEDMERLAREQSQPLEDLIFGSTTPVLVHRMD